MNINKRFSFLGQIAAFAALAPRTVSAFGPDIFPNCEPLSPETTTEGDAYRKQRAIEKRARKAARGAGFSQA